MQKTIRIYIIIGLIFLFASCLVFKLYLVQIVNGDSFRLKANHQYTNSTQNVYDRGTIYFQNKDGELFRAATLNSGFTLTINPKLIENVEDAYTKISSITPIDKNTFISQAGKKDDSYEEIARRVPDDVAQKIFALKIKGVSIYEDRWRTYPGNKLASNVLGFVGWKGDVLSGQYGLERYYDDLLARDNQNVYTNFFADLFLNINNLTNDRSEGDLITTIDPSISAALDSELKKVNEKWNSKFTAGIVINPQNGEIYAMSVYPTFDPNTYNAEKDPGIFSNPLVESVYEMGSIMKPLTMAAALDMKAVTAHTTYNDKGSITLNNKTIYNFDKKARGVVDMQEVLNQSLNVGMAFVAGKMGNKALSEYLLSYGLGEETGIDLPNEVRGMVKNLDSSRDVEHATAAFGQGIAVTPIETVRALSSLANGGLLINPHVVKKIDYKIGTSKNIAIQDGKRVLKKESSEEITRMLVEVVDKALLGGTVKMQNYSIAAKTGTAQIANNESGGYYADKYLHSFFGYFPAYNAKYLIFLYTVEPKGVSFASHTLTEPFIDITKFLINYYEVPPDR
ncbi:MAG: penicillin-binding protein 2 [Candidatus Paceibacterota bacterium]